ncbi:hypothetical protein ACT4R9_00660 [Ornithobacterium rhinotracheale]|uniref:hypothetical protein n=1 Tax=Ornithobacterium rhinotracheale TaxID=28251 RepID=UPI003FA46399
MKNKILLLLMFLFALSACEQFGDNELHVLKGRLIDTKGQAVPNAKLKMLAFREGVVIAKGLSDEQGYFNIVYPSTEVVNFSGLYQNPELTVEGFSFVEMHDNKPYKYQWHEIPESKNEKGNFSYVINLKDLKVERNEK